MKHFVIPPIESLDLTYEGTAGFFCLAHLYISNQKYRDFFRSISSDVNNYILLDNGAAENSLVDLDTLIRIVKELNPNEVIARDVLFDCDETIKQSSETIEALKEIGYTGLIMGVPQANNREDWMRCYAWMISNPDVDTIGLSKISVPKSFVGSTDDQGIKEGRNICFDVLVEASLLQKPIHCLGMGDPREYVHYQYNDKMRSTDSCNSVWSAMNGIKWYEEQFERIKTPHDYFDRIVTSEQYFIAMKNIEYLVGVMENL